jgi:hypothetical protein
MNQIIRDDGLTIFITPFLRKYGLSKECVLTDCKSENKKVTTILVDEGQFIVVCEDCYNKTKTPNAGKEMSYDDAENLEWHLIHDDDNEARRRGELI